jgi:putative ABC transport system permease protein
VASFRRVNWSTLGFNFVLVFSPGTFADVPHNLAATIDVPPARAGAVAAALLPRFPSTTVVEVGGLLDQVRDVVRQVAAAVAAAAGVAVAAGLAVLAGAIAATREARTYDAVMLKVLGATRAQVLAAQALEFLLLGVVLAAVALLLGAGGAWIVVTQLFGFSWLPDWGAMAAVLAGGVGTVLLFGLGGALPTLSARPARALRAL